jgi:hypothetical protein
MATATQLAQARQLFDVYATGLEPTESALNFWADAIANQGLAGATNSFLNPSDPNAPRLGIMRNDPEYLAATRPPPEVNPNPYSGEGSFQQTVGTQGNIRSLGLGDDFQEYEELGTDGPYTIYRVRSAYGDDLGTIRVQTGGGVEKFMEGVAPLIGFAAGVGGLGSLIGSSLGLANPLAAEAIGNAIASGLTTGAITGDAEKALIAAALAGTGTALAGSGVIGDALDTLGLGDYKETFGVLNSDQVSTITGTANDAVQLAKQGLGVNDIQTALIASGVDPVVAASAANMAATGASATSIAADITKFTGGVGVVGDVQTGPGTGLSTTTGAAQTGLTAGTAAGTGTTAGTLATTAAGGTALGSGLTAGTSTLGTAAAGTGAGTALGSGLTAGTATLGGTAAGTAAAGTMLGSGLTAAGTTLGGATLANTLGTAAGAGLTAGAGNLLGGALSGLLGNIPGLVNTGVNAAVQQAQIDRVLGAGAEAQRRISELASRSALSPSEYAELTRLAEQVKADTAAAGQASQVPFTPYTMTTGFGTTGVTPTGATATTAPAYEALRQQSLGLAGQTLGAINPAQAAQDLYNQVEAIAAPGRERDILALQNRLQRQGLLGFGSTLPTTGGGARTVNPLFESLLSAQETARAQQALAAQQFGTTEAGRQAALAQGLLGQAQGIDQQTLAQLQTTGQLGINLNQLEQANRARALQAQLQGVGVPLTTAGAAAQLRQQDLARQAQLGAAGEMARLQAAQAALVPQGQQTQAIGNIAQGLLTPIATAAGRSLTELFGLG